MLKNKKLFLSFFLISLAFVSIFALGKIAFASDISGTEVIENSIVLESTDPRNITIKIINIVFAFLGIIAVSLNVYAGFLWMTSAGNEDKIEKAKKTLRNALIGLAIILASWGIVFFVFRSLFPGENTGNGSSEYRDNFFRSGLGAIGNCSVESVYPSPGATDVARNTMLMVTFRENVSSSTFNMNNATVCKDEDFNVDTLECANPVNFTVNTVDNKTFVLSTSLLGNENNSTNYVVYLSNDIISLNSGNGIFENCSNNNFTWTFSVSNRLDLTPPQVTSVFPYADNEGDVEEDLAELAYARGAFRIVGSGQPNIYQTAMVQEIHKVGATTEATGLTATITPTYSDVFNQFTITIGASTSTAQMVASIGGSNTRRFNLSVVDNKVVGYDPLEIELSPSYQAGNKWWIEVSPVKQADSITVGGDVYYFGSGAGQIPRASASTLAANIANFINSNNQNVVATQNSNTVNLQARVGGTSGNGINLSSSNPSLISITPFSGGVDRTGGITVKGKPDQPMNSIIQINFNEAINPLTVSGTSEEVKNYISVINGSDIVSGKFSISSDYKTVEFKSDNKCAVNGCGEDIYCLPGGSNIKVDLKAAGLFNCDGNNNNCSNKSPYSSCITNICTDEQGKYYPLASVSPMSGIMDAAANSFDGNKNSYANGQVSYYNLNNPDINLGDNLTWSFWTSNKIETTPPTILSVTPEIGATSTDLVLPVKMVFNKLMMMTSLRTGELGIDNGNGTIIHRLVNLIAGQLVGYWISSENLDVEPLDGVYDRTTSQIDHARFYEGADYQAQIGSGVKDIYQNCFYPSTGMSCNLEYDRTMPYCCDGLATSTPCVE